jgi:hypothetical protein
VFLVAWLAGWYFGASSVLEDLGEDGLGKDTIMLVVWLVIWSLGGVAALAALLKSFGGEERMVVSATETRVTTRSRFWRGRERTYETGKIRRVRTDGRGLSFDYEGEPVSVFRKATPEDAERMVRELVSRYPHMEAADTA